MDGKKPDKLQTITLMQLITGILTVLWVTGAIISTCGMALLAVVPVYALIAGIMAIVSGAKGLGASPRHGMYRMVAIMQIVAIISLDVPAVISGILSLVFLGDPEVQAYLSGDSEIVITGEEPGEPPMAP